MNTLLVLIFSLVVVVNSNDYSLDELREGAELFVGDKLIEFEQDALAMNSLEKYYLVLSDWIKDLPFYNDLMLKNVLTIIYDDKEITRVKAINNFIKNAQISLIGFDYAFNWIEKRKNFVKYPDQKETLKSIQTDLFYAKNTLENLYKKISRATQEPTIESIEQRDQEVVLNIKDNLHDMYLMVDDTKEIEEVINLTDKAINELDKLFVPQENKQINSKDLPLYHKKN